MKKATFQTSIRENDLFIKKDVNGWLLENEKDLPLNDITKEYNFGVYKKEDANVYYVIELNTGMSVSGSKTRKQAIELASIRLDRLTLERFKKAEEESNDRVKKMKAKAV